MFKTSARTVSVVVLFLLLLYPSSAKAIPRLLVTPAIDEWGLYFGPYDLEEDAYLSVFADEFKGGSPDQSGFVMPASGGYLSVSFGGNNPRQVDTSQEIWLLTTSAAGASFEFAGQPFTLHSFDDIPSYGADEYYGLSLGSVDEVNPLLGVDWQSLTSGPFGTGNRLYYSLTGMIEYSDAVLGDWFFAYEANPGLVSPRTSSSAIVPEPATMLLFGTGLIGMAFIGRRKLNRKKKTL